MKKFTLILLLLIPLVASAGGGGGHGGHGGQGGFGGIPVPSAIATNQPDQSGSYSYEPAYSPREATPGNQFPDDMSPGAAGPRNHPNWNYPAPWEPGAGGFYSY